MRRGIVHVPEYEKEFKEIVERSGVLNKWKAKDFQEWYSSLVEKIALMGERCIKEPYFEKLKGTRDVDLYSMRLAMKRPNIRVIFTFFGDFVIFLAAFVEKSKSDYERAIEKAKRRYEKYRGDLYRREGE